ncbi:MAG: glycoside hydrolase family 3 protein [Acidimicrobiales bacterium]
MRFLPVLHKGALLGILVMLVAVGCGNGSSSSQAVGATTSAQAAETTSTPDPPTSKPPTTTTTEPTTTTTDPVLAMVEMMTLQDKIGQMLMPVLRGTGVDTVTGADVGYNSALGGFGTPAEIVAAYRLGGIMYLGPNVVSPQQIGEFSRDLQEIAIQSELPGLLIAADQEGGRVLRIRGEGITPAGSARSLAGDASAVYDAALLTGHEMSGIGINVVFAPVADVVRSDVGVIGNRSYGSDPLLVAEMVTASVSGLKDGGVAPVAKHWPGHGATEVDSHRELPTVASSEQEWRTIDLPPFESAVDADTSAIMVGHLAVPSLGSSEPATISPRLTEDLVRSELGFGGVLFTDAMDMRALDGIEEAELAVRVVEAGIDILLVPPDLAAAVSGITNAVSSGRISEQRLDASVERILQMKDDLGLLG